MDTTIEINFPDTIRRQAAHSGTTLEVTVTRTQEDTVDILRAIHDTTRRIKKGNKGASFHAASVIENGKVKYIVPVDLPELEKKRMLAKMGNNTRHLLVRARLLKRLETSKTIV